LDLGGDGGAGGVRYTQDGSTATPHTSTQVSTDFTNLRQLNIFDGQLYVSSGSSTLRLGAVGTGTPTTAGQTITNLPGIDSTTLPSPYGFYLADLTAAVSGVDTLYVADDSLGLRKFSLVSGTWTLNGTIGVDADDYRGLTASVSGSTVTLFATRKGGSGATGGGELVSLVDNSGYNGSFSGAPTLLDTADANMAFRGVAFAPVAAGGGGDTTPPSFTSPNTFNAPENQTAVGTVVATDATTPVTYSLNGGEDAALFAIDLNTGVLTFVAAPDFEGGASFDGDDIYEVTVRASDAVTPANAADQQIEVTVTDVPEGGPPQPLVINEIDADQSGTDAGEFIELYGTPGASLNGYTVVLYNGSDDKSYAAFDLDGFSLDANGYFVLGDYGVTGVDLIFANNILQNGADAVALYLGDATAFPNGTAVTAANLVDAVVYENNNPDDRGLIDVLTPGQAQVNENERGASFTQSLQRVTDGAGGALNTTQFTQAPSTPGTANALPATPAAAASTTHLIHDVQGPGATSPLAGTTVTVEGIVVGDFQAGDSDVRRSLNGFYLQEENAQWDADPLSSEGVFIFSGSAGYLDVNEGDIVRVTGTVSEFNGMTEITVSGVTVVSTGNALPAAVAIDLPTAGVSLAQSTASDTAMTPAVRPAARRMDAGIWGHRP